MRFGSEKNVHQNLAACRSYAHCNQPGSWTLVLPACLDDTALGTRGRRRVFDDHLPGHILVFTFDSLSVVFLLLDQSCRVQVACWSRP